MYYSPKDCSNGQVLPPLLSERKVNERILRSQTMQMVVHMNLWRPLMCCKLTVVNPKIRRCLKHRAVGTDGNQRTLPGYITSDLPTTRAYPYAEVEGAVGQKRRVLQKRDAPYQIE